MLTTNLNGKTPDIAEENIQKLKQIFPDVFTEGKVDLEKLQQVLGNYTEDSNERYNFTWNGKGRALRLSQTPSQGTLRPCKEESKDWDTTQNLYIEGDNLEVLKLLQKSYHGKVRVIYIDPPYNTGNDFIYPDDFHDSLENYKKITGQVDSEGNRIGTNTETSGRYHTDWLNMMYPRLRLARNLLADDGVIFISIGDDEVDNLKKICTEVLGESNYITCCPRIAKRTSNKGTYFKPTKDYVLVYSKNLQSINWKFGVANEISIDDFPLKDEKGYYKKNGASLYQPSLDSRPNQRYWIECPDGSFIIPPGNVFPDKVEDAAYVKPISNSDKVWRWSWPTYLENKDKLIFTPASSTCPLIDSNGNPSKWNIYDKVYFEDKDGESLLPEDVIYDFVNSQGTKEILALEIPFSFAKPSGLIKYLINICKYDKDIIVLDFFSGSATTAHAVMQLNAEDGGNRKFICVQLPEPCDESSEAFKVGYKNICEIGKERIRRVGEKIKQEKGLEAQNLDIGFKVLKLDSSNIRKWQPDYENLEQTLLDYIDNYVDGRTELDVVYEIMLKYGLDLTYPVDEFTIAEKKVYSIGFGMLMICLDDKITTEVAKGILAQVKELAPESTRVVFKDNGFKTDSNKTNIKEILKCGGIEEFITL